MGKGLTEFFFPKISGNRYLYESSEQTCLERREALTGMTGQSLDLNPRRDLVATMRHVVHRFLLKERQRDRETERQRDGETVKCGRNRELQRFLTVKCVDISNGYI